jgi:folate-dependent phosphoribosylglycinamide formyltransferase PurN
MLTPIYNPKKGKMRVAGLVSGSGKSLVKIIEQQLKMEDQGKSTYEVVGIFTENPASKATKIGKEHNVPVFTNDIKGFYESRGKKITDRRVREEFDLETVKALTPLKPDVLVYAGYVWAATSPLVDAFLGVNGHPADLSIVKEGKRAYAGAYGVRDALMAGETELRSTAHLVTTEIDGGPILLISDPVRVEKDRSMNLEESSRYYLKFLNEKIRILFAKVVKDLSEGVIKRDETGMLYYGETPIPKGYSFSE